MSYTCIVAQCARASIVWIQFPTGPRSANWVCQKDQFAVPVPTAPTEVEAALLAMAQHSVQLAGTLQSVVQLTV